MRQSYMFWQFWGLISGIILLWRIPQCDDTGNEAVTYESVSIVIPARNEASTLPYLLESIRSRNNFTGQVIVIDDHSSDDTAAIAESYGATVIRSSPLPDGWMGKTWACFQGAKFSTGEMLVFLDADTIIYPGGLQRMISTFNHQSGVVSIAPYHITRKLYEQFSAVFNIIVLSSVNAFSLFSSHRKPMGLFGPCLIVSRNDYDHIGGHESVKGRILENLFMAEKFKEKNIDISCYGGNNVLSYRMYPDGIKQLIQGWSKIFVSGASQTELLTTLLISLWFAGNITVPISIILWLFNSAPESIIVSLILYLCFVIEHFWMLKRIGSFYLTTALFFPIFICFFLFVFTRSMINHIFGTGVQWKDRTLKA